MQNADRNIGFRVRKNHQLSYSCRTNKALPFPKNPCIMLHLTFLASTTDHLRQKIVALKRAKMLGSSFWLLTKD
jgi:hypothetical protein